MREKVLITGGAGFIGSHIVDKLAEGGYDIVVVDNLSSGSRENLRLNSINLYENDIVKDNIEFIFQQQKPDYVIHLAAQTSVPKSTESPLFDADANIMGSIKMLNLSKKYNVKKFIASSSAAVYGMPEYLPVDEKHPTNPISFYGLSKLTMEKYIQLFDVPYIIFRFANVYGPRQASSQESGVVAIFNDAMINKKEINIFGDGEQIRDFVYVKDIANTVFTALKSDVKNEIINISTNKGVKINELFEYMQKIYDYPYKSNYMPPREGDIKDSILSNSKAKKLLSMNTYTEIKDGLCDLKNSYVKESIC